MNAINLEYKKIPHPFKSYFFGLLTRRKGLKSGEKIPLITLSIKKRKINIKHLNKFLKTFDLDENSPIPLTYPLTLVFPLHLPIILHKKFPIIFYQMMQIRNHIIQHRPLERNEIIDIHCRVLTERRVAKGIEIDVISIISVEEKPVWENLNTYFFPGRFGDAGDSSPLAKMVSLPEKYEVQVFTIPARGGFRFCSISGDFNGIHFSSLYARLMGFERSFAQPHMCLTKCLIHTPQFELKEPLRLDVAYKGPVYYDIPLTMKYSNIENESRFNLYCKGNDRPSIVCSISEIKANQLGKVFY